MILIIFVQFALQTPGLLYYFHVSIFVFAGVVIRRLLIKNVQFVKKNSQILLKFLWHEIKQKLI